VALERAAGGEVEGIGRKLAHGVAIEPPSECQVLGEPVSCGEQRLLDLLRGQLEFRGDLRDAQALDLAEEVRGALALRQGAQRLDERGAQSGRLVVERGLAVLVQLGDDGTAPPRLERGVVRDPVEPRAQMARLRAAAQSLVRAEQRDLRNVLPGRRIARDATGIHREPARVEPVQLVEGGGIARRDSTR
jgi:hypothetical protein